MGSAVGIGFDPYRGQEWAYHVTGSAKAELSGCTCFSLVLAEYCLLELLKLCKGHKDMHSA